MVVAEGGTLTCSVRVNKAWTAETDCDWLTITTVRCGDADPSTVTGANNGASLSNGVATVKATGLPYITTKVEVGRNSGGESRTGHIIIKSEGAEIEKVAVTQASGAQITIEGLTDNTLELSDNPTESGAEVKFTVNAPYPWTIAPSGAAAWYEVSPGQGAANTDVEVTVKALEQNLSFRRFGEFTITAAEGDATLTEKIALSQQPVSPGTVKWNLASPVQWSFSEEDMGNYAQDFKGGPDSPYNTVLAQSGPGYLSYTHTAPSDPDKKCERIVGSTGHPYITGGWPGDYWTFAVPVTNLDAGTKVRFTAITRTSATGHKFWRMEYNDGGTWKPAAALQTTTETGEEVSYTHAMKADGTTYITVDVTVTYANAISGGNIEFRFVCAANWQANGKGAINNMKLKTYIRNALATAVMLLVASAAWAQSRNITGIVFDTDGKSPLVGATVILKGTATGTISNADGTYTIHVGSDNDVLVFQSLGYDPQEVTVGSRTTINVTLKESAQKIDEVVVTALGLTRSEKSVGYAVSKVSGDELTKSISSNWVTGLNGKVAGMSMSSAGTGPGGTVRVTLRGDTSLNYGANEALFVIDGIPMSNGTVASGSGANYANSNAPVDFGNPISDLNPDDIENVSVLKGPAAAALYGSMGQNGVVLITTKSGREQRGIGVTYNGSVTFETAGFWPEFQEEYGPSAVTTSLTNRVASAWGLPGTMTYDGQPVRQQISRYTYGEHFDSSKLRYLYMSKNWETGEFTPLPWVYADDWFTGLFETGVTWSNSVTIDGSTGKGTSTRFSFTDLRNDWITPNSGYEQQTFALALNQKISKAIKLAAKVNYIRKNSDNMPMSGYSQGSPMYGLIWGYNTNPISAYRDEYMQGRYTYANYLAGSGEDKYNTTSGLIYNSLEGHNPYRTLYEELNKLDRDRFFGNVSIDFTILPELTFTLRGGFDANIEWRSQQKPFMSLDNRYGMYREKTIRRYDYNSDFLLKYNKLWDRFGVTAAFGGSVLRNKYYSTTITASQLSSEGPGMYSFANAAVALDTSPYRSNRQTNSLYGFVNLSWDDTYFLDVTARNDWSSTLAPSNWSYFYPSVSASILLDKAFKINSPHVNMIKLRGSWAQVGNDTSVFSLYDDYSTTDYPGGVTLPTASNYPYILPEKTSSWEVGLETKFLGNRLNVDVALYKTSTRNQIISAETSAETGSTSRKMNAGLITNKGVEVTFRMVPVRTKDINWEINGNWSLNKNKLNELQNGWDPATPLQTSTSTTIGSRIFVYSYVGKSMHQLYSASHYEYAPEGSTYTDENGNQVDCSGMQIINAKTGYPLLTKETDSKKFEHLGSVIPDWKAGFGTTFRYKNLSLSAQFTAQVGGVAYSVTNFALSYQGKLKNSLAGRDDGLVLQGVNAVDNGDGTVSYQKNTAVTENIYTYYQSYKWVRDNGRENTFSTDFLKFKELRIDYQLPKHLMAKTRFLQGASIGFFATNLFCITDWPQFDPEAAGLVNGTNIYPGIETVTFPMTRTYGINIKLQF